MSELESSLPVNKKAEVVETDSKPKVLIFTETLMNELEKMSSEFLSNFKDLTGDVDLDSMKAKKLVFDSVRALINDISKNPAYLKLAVENMNSVDKQIILMKIEESRRAKELARSGKALGD